jgi:hypothetical protein
VLRGLKLLKRYKLINFSSAYDINSNLVSK